tara:strand:- start:175 stop:450 length:276 start_codon:yes stop_codon:yes gene_type:complete
LLVVVKLEVQTQLETLEVLVVVAVVDFLVQLLHRVVQELHVKEILVELEQLILLVHMVVAVVELVALIQGPTEVLVFLQPLFLDLPLNLII